MNRFEAVGFGALNVDKLFKVNRIAGEEEESFVESQQESCGGSAANTIVGLARLGCKVGFIGQIGPDREGKMLIEDFRKEGVDTSGVNFAKEGKSGAVMGFVDKKGARALYIDSGVNDTILLDQKTQQYAVNTKFLHLTSFVGEQSFQSQKKLLDVLPASVKVSFDPGAIYARKGFAQLEPLIRRSYALMPNEGELKLITGKVDYREGAGFLIERDVTVVAVKLGGRGCYVTNGLEHHLIKAVKTKVIDTTGAGDAFCAGFLFGLLKNMNLFECGRIGNLVAAKSIAQMGARGGLPFKGAVESFQFETETS
jgi:ribokinase